MIQKLATQTQGFRSKSKHLWFLWYEISIAHDFIPTLRDKRAMRPAPAKRSMTSQVPAEVSGRTEGSVWRWELGRIQLANSTEAMKTLEVDNPKTFIKSTSEKTFWAHIMVQRRDICE